jgi:hypothetical protein
MSVARPRTPIQRTILECGSDPATAMPSLWLHGREAGREIDMGSLTTYLLVPASSVWAGLGAVLDLDGSRDREASVRQAGPRPPAPAWNPFRLLASTTWDGAH